MTNTQKLATLGIAGPIIFALGIILAGTQFDGYSHIKQEISQLGGIDSQYPWIQNFNFYLLSLCVVGFAFALHKAINGGSGSALGPILIGVFGVSSAGLSGVFPCDALCEGVDAAGKLHLITSLIGFVSFAIGLIVVSRRMKKAERWQTWGRYTLITGILAFVLFFVAGAAGGDEADGLDGLLQRIFIANFLIWILLTGLRIVRSTDLSQS